jgi:NAD(P)-dependent dehydrogenase (short-subunit alcohol dehydrogenase family)
VDLLEHRYRVAGTFHEAEPNVGPTSSVRWYRCDVADREATREIVRAAERDHGQRVAVLVHASGVADDDLAVHTSGDMWRRMLEVNLTGAFNVLQPVLRSMVRERFGRAVFVASVAAAMGSPGQSAYAAAKAGVIGLVRSTVREVASRGITLNVVLPGPIDTEMIEPIRERMEAVVALSPSGRLGTPADVAAAVGFLVSDQARHVNGVVLPVDGGLSMGF